MRVYSLTYDHDSGLGTCVFATEAQRDAALTEALESFDIEVPDGFRYSHDDMPEDMVNALENKDARFTWEHHDLVLEKVEA